MSVVVTQSPSAAVFHLDSCSWTAPAECYRGEDDPAPPEVEGSGDEDRPAQVDVWSAIQSQKTAAGDHPAEAPYVHPLLRRSSSLLSQKSLETCTESLCSETGSDDFSSLIDGLDYFQDDTEEEKEEADELVAAGSGIRRRDGAELTTPVNFQCSNRRRPPQRSFPPPLPSLSQRNSPCLHMRPHRVDGRLVVEAVAVPSKNYLQSQRVDGRLLLSFTSTAMFGSDALGQLDQIEGGGSGANETKNVTRTGENEELEENNSCYDEEEEEDDDEEQVEVVDRGTVVEVKVSSQPQLQNGAMKVHRSLLVINKFVGGTPLNIGVNQTEKPTAGADYSQNEHNLAVQSAQPPRRAFPTTSTAAAAAVVAASTLSFTTEGYSSERANGGLWAPTIDHHPPPDNKLLFTSKRRNRDELLHSMRRCSQLRCRPLFVWESCYIATSS